MNQANPNEVFERAVEERVGPALTEGAESFTAVLALCRASCQPTH